MSSGLAQQLGPLLIDARAGATLESHGRVDSAVLVPLFQDGGELCCVFTRRRENLRRHAGEISFPGGRQDEGDEDLIATALREAWEEIGLAPEAVEVIGALQPIPTLATAYAVHPFVGVITHPGAADRGDGAGGAWVASASEVAEVLELGLGALRAGYARANIERRGVSFRTDTFAIGDGGLDGPRVGAPGSRNPTAAGSVIWGATARILSDLLERMDGPLGVD